MDVALSIFVSFIINERISMGCIIENTVTPSIRRRVGQDYHVSWPVEVVGEDIALKDCDLTLEVVNPWQEKSYPSFSISEDGSSIEFDLPGTEYNVVGNYTFVIWRNFRKEGQSVCDVFEAITLVNHTYEECGEPDEDDISIESIKLESGRIYIGYKGDKGDPFKFEDFTPEQLEMIRGPKGDPLKFEDLTPEQISSIVGPKGDTGVGVESFKQTFKSNADGGANIYLLTLTDGRSFQIVVNNGNRGSQGEKGVKGDKGDKGDDGITPDMSDYYNKDETIELLSKKVDNDDIVVITQEEYDALEADGTVDPNKIYYIVDDEV